jgi:uroporphyrinogen-III synthase
MTRFQDLDSGLRFTHVLITRPQPEAGQLAALFDGSGLQPVIMPAFGFEPVAVYPEQDLDRRTNGRLLVVFTSKRAVEFGLPRLPREFLGSAEVAAIGPASAAALDRAGVQVSLLPDGQFTSEAMLAHPDLARDPGRAVIVAAPGGRDALRRGLSELGWQVRVLHVYRRQLLDPGAEQVQALLASTAIISVWTSENAMRALADSVPPAAWRRVLDGAGVVTSGRLRQCLASLGLANVSVARAPDNESIYRAVLELI